LINIITDYLWMAPELLRLVPQKRPLCGTKESDVYSYGIILQEICFQQKPFGILLDEFGASGKCQLQMCTYLCSDHMNHTRTLLNFQCRPLLIGWAPFIAAYLRGGFV